MNHERDNSLNKGVDSKTTLPLHEDNHRVIQRGLIDYCTNMDIKDPSCMRELTVTGAAISSYRSPEFSSILGENCEPEQANLYFTYCPNEHRTTRQTEPDDFKLELYGPKLGSQVQITGDANSKYWLRPMYDATHDPFWHGSANANYLDPNELKMLLAALPNFGKANEALILHPDTGLLSASIDVAKSLYVNAQDTSIRDTSVLNLTQPHMDTHVIAAKTNVLSQDFRHHRVDQYFLAIQDVMDTTIPVGFKNNAFILTNEQADQPETTRLIRTREYTFSHDANGHINPGLLKIKLRSAEHGGTNNERYIKNLLFAERMAHLKRPENTVEQILNVLHALENQDVLQQAA